MPFGFGKKEEVPFKTDITDKDELDEIRKIADRLDPDEKVLLVAKQARARPGGSITTPNTIFATEKRLLIKDPSALGLRQSIEDIGYDKITSARLEKGVFSSKIVLRAPGFSTMAQKKLNLIAFASGSDEGEIEAIPKDKAEKLIEIIRAGMERMKKAAAAGASAAQQQQPPISMADELAKLAKLKEQGVLSDAEFQHMKQELLKRL